MSGRGKGRGRGRGSPVIDEDGNLTSALSSLSQLSVVENVPSGLGRGRGRGSSSHSNLSEESPDGSQYQKSSSSSSSGRRSSSRGRGMVSRNTARRPMTTTEQYEGVLDDDKLSSLGGRYESALSVPACDGEKRSSSDDHVKLNDDMNPALVDSLQREAEQNKQPKNITMKLECRPGVGSCAQEKFQVASNFYRARGSPKDAYLYTIDCELLSVRPGRTHPILNYEEAMMFFEQVAQQLSGSVSPTVSNDGSAVSTITASTASTLSSTGNTISKQPMYFDGSHLFYTIRKFPDLEMMVERTERPINCRYRTVAVAIKKVKDLKLFLDNANSKEQMDQQVLHFFETVLKSSLYRKNYTRVNSSFFLLNKTRPVDCFIPAKNFFEGFHITMKHIHAGLAIQPKDKVGVFHKPQPLLNYLEDFFQTDVRGNLEFWQNEFLRRQATEAVKGLKVKLTDTGTSSNGKVKVIKDISAEGACHLTFPVLDGRVTNVADYFAAANRRKLTHPYLPCVLTKKYKRENPENPGETFEHFEYFPMEMCFVEDKQPVKGTLDPDVISKLIRIAAKPAPQTFNAIRENMRQARQELQEQFDNLGVEVEESMIKTEARIMPTPTIEYGNTSINNVMNGTWSPQRFVRPHNITNWGCCIATRRPHRDGENIVRRAIDILHQSARQLGIDLSYPAYDSMPNVVSPNQLQEFLEWCEEQKFELVLVVLDSKNSEEYSKTKFLAERLTGGVLTQCVLMNTLKKLNNQSAQMILMKINAKLGGLNARVDLKLFKAGNGDALFPHGFPVMIQGLETNVMPGQDSILGLASSFDPSATSYTMQTEITSNPNIITSMIDLQMQALKTYFKITKEKPKAIIFFRTAVNEHQMQQTLGFEYRAIKVACRKLEQDYEPKITYIMATKKHATRLCATDKRFQIGKSQNVPAGTVVDTAIVDRSRFDFYLQSSQGIQGTSIPTKYTVCQDENKLSADSVQGLCYYLCHGYVRCNRTVSRPNCLMYAKLATDRARAYMKAAGNFIENYRQKSVQEHMPDILDIKRKFVEDFVPTQKKKKPDDNRLAKTMFFT